MDLLEMFGVSKEVKESIVKEMLPIVKQAIRDVLEEYGFKKEKSNGSQ